MRSIIQNRYFDGFVVGMAVALSLAFAAQSTLAPRDPQAAVAVIFPPWIGGAQALSRAAEAGASVVRTGRFETIVVAVPADDGYAQRAAALGAWFVADPQWLTGCLEAPGA